MRLSVIIPCRNEKEFIEECVRAVYACDLPEDTKMKVLVVDGMSDDGTLEVLKKLKNEFSSLEILENKKQLTPYAFNIGVEYDNQADFIQIVGARHILSKKYLIKNIEKLNSDPSIWCVGGRAENKYTSSLSELIAKVMAHPFGMGIGNFRTLKASGFVDTVGTPMYPSFVFEKIGLFDEELVRNQDDEFNFRVIKAGGKIYYNHDVSLKYYVRSSIEKVWRQFFQYGYWKVYVNKKHKAVTTLRQLVPPVFVLYLLTLPLTTLLSGIWSPVLLVLYLLMGSIIAIQMANNVSSFVRLFFIFPVLHIGYGLGYLMGVFHFLILGRKPSSNQARLSR